MDYEQVEGLAEQVAAAGSGLAGGQATMSTSPDLALSVPLIDDLVFSTMPAFGNTDSAHDCLSAYSQARQRADDAVAALIAVLNTDAGRLVEAVSTFRSTDHENADQILSAASRGVNIYSAHVHSDGSNNDDVVRAGQIDRLRGNIEGPAVLGADLNAELDDGNLSAAAVDAYEQGFDVEAGEVGGTSHSGRSIDYIMPTDGIQAGDPSLVDGGPSDHNGQRVDLTIPNW